MSSNIKFTVFTKPWKLHLADLARLVRDLGFAGIELPVRPEYEVEPQSMAKDLPKAVKVFADEGLSIASVACEPTIEAIEAMGNAGVKLMRVIFPIPPEENYLACIHNKIRFVESLQGALASAGVMLGIQNHCRRQLSGAMELRYMVDRLDPKCVGAVVDICHNALAGESPSQALDLLEDRMCLVNFKNAYWYRTNDPSANSAAWDVRTTTARHGMADWKQAVDELKKRNYAGDICLSAEYTDHSAGLENLVREDLNYARSLFGK